MAVQVFKQYLLQSQIRLIDAQIAEMTELKEGVGYSVASGQLDVEDAPGYGAALEDQISSLKEVKKVIENL
jgi:hypothetical protein